MVSKAMVHLAYTVHLSWFNISTISKRTEMSFLMSLETWSVIRCVQNDFYANGTLAHTVHLFCTDTNIVSERTETRFHMIYVI
jgi:hypothetical protein